ncbi:glycosyltransferase family 4 protein [Pontibacter pamirensis]|uniref:glycosyltransferase family 4 protein n=1 Tax=Pontibacter pamirensis TaxID=2562824 RepID=UPI0013899F68|nr:glycosyltransferase family 4 protein [Pontibacter pamirensis]
MRVLHLASEKTWRGGEQQTAYLIEELQKLSIECHVACRKGSSFEQYCLQHQIPHITLSFSKVLPLATAYGIKNYTNKHRIDIIHMHTSNAHTMGVLAHLLGARATLILSRRVEFAIGKNAFSQFKYNYSGIKRILCVSARVCQVMAASVRDAGKCTVLYDGISLERFAQHTKENASFLRRHYSIAPDDALIGNISAIDKDKDYYTFLDTAKALKEANVKAKYIAIGKGPLEHEIKAYTKKLGLEQDVIFTGFINNVPEVLPELDLLLFTSLKEGLGTTILDAFACRVPVVATSTGGIPEIVEDGKTGFLTPVKRPDLMAEKVLCILKDSDLRHHLVQQAAERVLMFTKEQTALKTLDVYKEVLSLH